MFFCLSTIVLCVDVDLISVQSRDKALAMTQSPFGRRQTFHSTFGAEKLHNMLASFFPTLNVTSV